MQYELNCTFCWKTKKILIHSCTICCKTFRTNRAPENDGSVYVCIQVNRKKLLWQRLCFHLIPPKEPSVFTNLTLSLKYILHGCTRKNVPMFLHKRKSVWEVQANISMLSYLFFPLTCSFALLKTSGKQYRCIGCHFDRLQSRFFPQAETLTEYILHTPPRKVLLFFTTWLFIYSFYITLGFCQEDKETTSLILLHRLVLHKLNLESFTATELCSTGINSPFLSRLDVCHTTISAQIYQNNLKTDQFVLERSWEVSFV